MVILSYFIWNFINNIGFCSRKPLKWKNLNIISILSCVQKIINLNSCRVGFICIHLYHYLIFGKYLINVADSSSTFLVITDYIYFTLHRLAIILPGTSCNTRWMMTEILKYATQISQKRYVHFTNNPINTFQCLITWIRTSDITQVHQDL